MNFWAYTAPVKQHRASLSTQMHRDMVFYTFFQWCQILGVVKCLRFHLHAFVQASMKVQGTATGPAALESCAQKSEHTEAATATFHLLSMGVSMLSSPSSLPASPGQHQDNILLQICSHQVIDEVRKTNTLKGVRLDFSLLNLWAKSGLAQCKSSCWCSLSSSFRQCHFARASMKEGVRKTLQAGNSGWLPPSLVTANSTFSPTLSDSVCSQARGNRNTSLLFHTPSSPQQQMGKYYYFFFKFSRPHTHRMQIVQVAGWAH